MKIEPVFKNKKLVTIPNEKQRRICKRKTQIKKLKMIKKEQEKQKVMENAGGKENGSISKN